MIRRIFEYLTNCGQPVYLVGGSLRQWLLDKPVKDYDFVVPKGAIRLAYQLADYFRLDCFPLDRERDMARVVMGDLVLDFAPYGKDLSTDLQARDLSINAMACPVDVQLLSADPAQIESVIIDPCGGLKDLRQGLVRGVSVDNFLADPLRMLRVYRFAAVLNFKIEPETESWVQQHADQLKQVAMERMLQELLPIVLLPQAASWVFQLSIQGLLKAMLPTQVDCEQMTAFETLSARRSTAENQTYLMSPLASQRPRLFAFKLGTLILNPQGSRGLSGLKNLLETLTLSRKECESLLRWQALSPQLLKLFEVDGPVERFHLFRQAQEDIYGLVLLARLWLAQAKVQGSEDLLDELLIQWQDPDNQIAHPRQWLDGHELIKELKLRPGPGIGQLLLAIQEAQACGKVGDKSEALAYARTLSLENGLMLG